MRSPLFFSMTLGAALAACHPTAPIQGGARDGGDGGSLADAGGTQDGGAPDSGHACGGLWARCGADPAGSCDTYLADDPQNCGACGHACPGGELCAYGSCQPTVLITGHKDAEGLVVAGGRVVWTDDDSLGGGVYSLPLSGGLATTLSSGFLFSIQVSAQRVRSDGEFAYYAYEGSTATLLKAPLDGSRREKLLLDHEERIGDLAVDQGAVYYTNPIAGTVRQVSVDGGAPPLVAANQATPTSIALGADAVYWTNLGAGGGLGSVMQAPLDGGSPTPIAEHLDEPLGLQLADDGLYWGTGDGEIVRAPLDGGPPMVVAGGHAPAVRDLAMDATTLYWVDQFGDVYRASRSGGAAKIIGRNARQLALDDQAVYWTYQVGNVWYGTPRGGGLQRLVKEP